jgi:hypothetical protein
MRFVFFTIFTSLLLLTSCRKEKTSWDTDLTVPIAHGNLTLEDLFDAENLETNSESFLSLIFHDTVYSFSLDTIANYPDTTIVRYLDLVPSTYVSIDPDYLSFNPLTFESNSGAIYFKEMICRSGETIVEIASPWPGKSSIIAGFPLFFENGVAFERTYNLEAGSTSSPTKVGETVDMTDFELDFTGVGGTGFNEVPAFLTISSDEETESYDIYNKDSIKLSFKFKDIIPKYARGYFGHHTISDTIGVSFSPLKKVLGGSIDIDSIDLNLTIFNGFKLLAQTKISKLSGINTQTSNQVDLSFPLLGNSININAASGNMSGHTPSEYPININSGNSNITEFLENLSDSIELGFELTVNPDGNISAGNDELFPTSTFDLMLDAELPLNIGVDDLVLVDTFNIEYSPIESAIPDNGNFELTYDNSFPLGASAYFYLMDDNNVVLDSIVSTNSILSGTYNSTTFETTSSPGMVHYTFDQATIENLEQASKIMLKVAFSTHEASKVKIDANAAFKFGLRTNLKIKVII